MPKPILSDSLFNADDVATAILDKANLSVANTLFAVTDVTSKFVLDSSFNVWYDNRCFEFNGFVFCSLSANYTGTPPGLTVVYTMDSDIRPSQTYRVPQVSYQGDTTDFVEVNPNGNISIPSPTNEGVSTYYIMTNFWYRL